MHVSTFLYLMFLLACLLLFKFLLLFTIMFLLNWSPASLYVEFPPQKQLMPKPMLWLWFRFSIVLLIFVTFPFARFRNDEIEDQDFF